MYFITGMSSIYFILQFVLLLKFVRKSKSYKLKFQSKQEHIQLFNVSQLSTQNVVLYALIIFLIYALNYQLDILPNLTVIWICLFSLAITTNLFGNNLSVENVVVDENLIEEELIEKAIIEDIIAEEVIVEELQVKEVIAEGATEINTIHHS